MENHGSDIELMAQLKTGDETAFRILVEQHHQAVYNLCYRYIGSHEDAEEIAQDVFIRLFRHAGAYQHTAKLSTYLYRIAVNLSLNRIRDRKRKKWLSLDFLRETGGMEPQSAASDRPDVSFELREKQAIVRQAVDSLPENQRTAVILHRFQGLSYEEIAEVMQCSIASLESRLHRAKAGLRKKLKNWI